MKWERGYLGYPVTDEINTVDGGGRVSRFEGGELIWREKTNTVREVKASDLVVELPFPAGETWYVIQSHAGAGGSHVGQFSFCWDFRRTGAQSQSKGKHFTAVANGRIVHADDSYGSGKGNPGNVVVQRLGPSRYASYLHNKPGSYTAHFGAGSLFLPQAMPWSNRPSASTGALLATMGDTGTGVGAYHLHFCVTTAPDRPGYKPFESVPVSFRNYEVSTLGLTWTDVGQGVPRAGQLLRRKGTQGSAAINVSAAPNGFGVVTAAVKLVGRGPARLQRRPDTHGDVGMGRTAEDGDASHRQHHRRAVAGDDHRRARLHGHGPEGRGHVLGRVEHSDQRRLDRRREQFLLAARGHVDNRAGGSQGGSGAEVTSGRLPRAGGAACSAAGLAGGYTTTAAICAAAGSSGGRHGFDKCAIGTRCR